MASGVAWSSNKQELLFMIIDASMLWRTLAHVQWSDMIARCMLHIATVDGSMPIELPQPSDSGILPSSYHKHMFDTHVAHDNGGGRTSLHSHR